MNGGSREVGEEQFVDHPRTCHAHRTLLLASLMSSHDHAARHTLNSHRHSRTVVETVHDLTFRTLLELIGREVQTCLDKWVIKHAVLFATHHKRDSS